ncbi:unnamed protein product [Schistosoma margrebowiei]|uniref:Uncharacterized protein n=1 Tax=Schistosoma margrebowiei TaxID=48269 RepID=A0A183MP53_9TREM|nr:unnamed protein product [Schistosoma margrebowiei]
MVGLINPDSSYNENRGHIRQSQLRKLCSNVGFDDLVLLGTRQQGVPVSFRELVLPDELDPVSPSFTVRDVTTKPSGPRPTSCRSEM